MARSMQYLTTDVISHLCFGEPFGFVKTHGDVYGFIATLESRLPFIENFSVIVELNRVLSAICSVPFLKTRLLPQPTDEDGLGKIVGVCLRHPSPKSLLSSSSDNDLVWQISRKVVDKRFEPNAVPRNDILGSFLKNKIPREQAESEITISL